MLAVNEQPERRFAITAFSGVLDNTAGRPLVVSWSDLARRLTNFTPADNKNQISGWSPATFLPTCTCGDKSCPGEKGHRIDDNAVQVALLTLDIDKQADRSPLDEVAAQAVLAKLESLRIGCVVHTTHSHAPPAHVSLRAVVQLSKAVPVHRWAAFWTAAIAHLGIYVESACRNPGRFWYAPSHKPAAADSAWSRTFEGAPLDVDALLAVSVPASTRPLARSTTYVPRAGAFQIDEFMSRHYPGARAYSNRGKRCWEIECPWEGEHSSSSPRDTVVAFSEGDGPSFSCLHSHCKDVRHWKEFRKFHEPDWVPFDERPIHAPPVRRSTRQPPPGTVPDEWERTEAELDRQAENDRDYGLPAGITVIERDQHPAAPTTAIAWTKPEPVGDRMPPVEQFDAKLLPADLQDWVFDIAYRMQVPLDFPAVAAMCALSVVATNARTIRPKQKDPWRVYPVLWGVTIGPPGAKKTPSANEAFSPLLKLDIMARGVFAEESKKARLDKMAHDAAMRGRKDELKRVESAKAKGGKNAPTEEHEAKIKSDLAALLEAEANPAKPRRYLTQDATVEKITDMVGRGSDARSYPLGVKCDELLGFFRMFDRDGREGDRMFYLEGWSVHTRATDRVLRGSSITRDLALIVFGNATPEPFEKYVEEAADGAGADGLLQRFQLMVYPDRPQPGPMVDEYANTPAKDRAYKLFERLAAFDDDDEEKRPRALHFNQDAQNFYNAWHEQFDRELATSDEHHSLRAHFAKYASLMPAIALVCHLADGPGRENTPVSLWAAERAAMWCKYLASHARRIYSTVGDKTRQLAIKISELIRRGELAGEMHVRHVYRALKSAPSGTKDALALLEDLGWVRLYDVKSGGRNREMVAINPLANERKRPTLTMVP